MSVRAMVAPVLLTNASLEDVDEVAELESRAFPVPWRRESFVSEVGLLYRYNRIARTELGHFAGYAFCTWAGGELHINKIATEVRYRRLGVARRLMRDIEAFALREGMEDMFLEVRVSNGPARALYESLGFEDLSRRPSYYVDGEDALVLVKNLTDS